MGDGIAASAKRLKQWASVPQIEFANGSLEPRTKSGGWFSFSRRPGSFFGPLLE
jgi:hypothetical protein